MTTKDSAVEKWGAGIGTAMVIAWFVFLGPIGLALLCGVAYAMIVQNLALGLLCGLLCFTPLMLVGMWGSVHLYALLSEQWAKEEAPTTEPLPEPVNGD